MGFFLKIKQTFYSEPPFTLPEPELGVDFYCLTGPTAVGKTALALEWAGRYGAEIVSCDALLFYRGADIGTAKPSKAEQAIVPHHGIDLVEPDTVFDIGQYTTWAQACVEGILARGKRVLVVGGSGFYLKSFFQKMVDEVSISPEIHAQVVQDRQAGGLEALLNQLRACNPGLAVEAYVDPKNPRRVENALKRCLASGETLQTLQARWLEAPKPFAKNAKKLWVLERSDADLKKRISARADLMLAQGLVGEVRALIASGFLSNPTLSSAIGYREPLAFLQKTLPEEALASTIIQNTWRLVRKQRTWSRTQL